MTFLKGYRTYILAACGLITVGAYWFGFIGADAANALLTVFGFGGLMTVRAAIK